MADRELLFEFWRNVINESGLVVGGDRDSGPCVEGKGALTQLLASFLVKNEFTKLDQLQQAEHPGNWTGADALGADELEVVWKLRGMPRKSSRCESQYALVIASRGGGMHL